MTLLWEDQARRHLLASARLYFLPEDTPKGRSKEHGEVGSSPSSWLNLAQAPSLPADERHVVNRKERTGFDKSDEFPSSDPNPHDGVDAASAGSHFMPQ